MMTHGLDSCGSRQGLVAGSLGHGNETSNYVKDEEISQPDERLIVSKALCSVQLVTVQR